MSWFDLYDEARGRIFESDARRLLLWAFDISMEELLARYTEDGVDEEKAQKFRDAVARCERHEPVQYVTGEQEFCGFPMYVDSHVLIPRLDTEVLVETVLEECGSERAGLEPACGQFSDAARCGSQPKKLLDLCTGSGCIAIALDKLGHFTTYGSDISREALEIADRNAEANGADIIFYESNLLDQIPVTDFDVIVSNPPYIASAVVDTLAPEVRDHEPRLALDGAADGLHFYREIARTAPSHLKPGGRLFLEIGYDQGPAVKKILEENGFRDIEIRKDLVGLDRVVCSII